MSLSFPNLAPSIGGFVRCGCCFISCRGLRSAGQADQGVTVLRQALEGSVDGIDEQVRYYSFSISLMAIVCVCMCMCVRVYMDVCVCVCVCFFVRLPETY